jgi:hypothetical protein
MTAGAARTPPREAVPYGEARQARPRPGVRLVGLHAASRRVPAALGLVAACAAGLRIALHWHWDTYGALQMPLVFEAGCAAVIAVTTVSPFGEPERATGRWLPFLRLGAALVLTAAAAGALAGAGTGAHLAGLTEIGLLCAVVLGGALAWTGPLAYLMVAVYALYTDWHGPALTSPWIWPARPPDDRGAAICAALVFAAGVALIAVRGARDSVRD